MQVRRARQSDIDVVAALFDQYRVFYGKASDIPLARNFISERMRLQESVLFLAETPAKTGAKSAAGFVQLYPSFSSVSAARIYVLNDLFVAEEHRRAGVARQLMHAAQGFAQVAGAHAMRLSTDKANHAGQALYESLGWERDEVYFYYGLTIQPTVQNVPNR